MELQAGDWVQTDSGLNGRVIHVSRLSAFVELQLDGGVEILPFLVSELARVDAPHTEPPEPNSPHS